MLALLSLALVVVPGMVFWLAARRLWQSRSRNAVLYWLVGAFAGAGAIEAVRLGLAGYQGDAGGIAVALASLPLWLVVRLATARRAPPAYEAAAPIFASIRRGGVTAGAAGTTPSRAGAARATGLRADAAQASGLRADAARATPGA